MSRGRVVISSCGSRDKKLMMRNCDRLRCSTRQLKHSVKATTSFGEVAAELCKNAETNPGSPFQLCEVLLRPKSTNFLIVSAGRTQITKMSRQSPLLSDNAASQ